MNHQWNDKTQIWVSNHLCVFALKLAACFAHPSYDAASLSSCLTERIFTAVKTKNTTFVANVKHNGTKKYNTLGIFSAEKIVKILIDEENRIKSFGFLEFSKNCWSFFPEIKKMHTCHKARFSSKLKF